MTIDPFPQYIDSSMLANFKACEAKWYWNNLRLKQRRGGNIHLHAGGAFARGLEETRNLFYAKGLSPDDAIMGGVQELWRTYGDYDDRGHAKSADKMAIALAAYFDRWPLGKDGFPPAMLNNKPAVEFNFAIPLDILHPVTGNPILFCGRFDMIGVYAAGSLFGLDDKTTGGNKKADDWVLRGQFLGYIWAAAQSGLQLNGFIVRVAKILKTEVSMHEWVMPANGWMVDRWYSETMSVIQDMIETWKSQRFRHDMADACTSYGGCPFLLLCRSQKPDNWLDVDYEPNLWTPVQLADD